VPTRQRDIRTPTIGTSNKERVLYYLPIRPSETMIYLHVH